MKIPILHRFERFPYILRLIAVVILILFSFGTVIHLIEPAQFRTIFDGIWWTIITASTIGYGDYIPTTTWGRIVTIVLVLVGVGFLSTYFVALATMFIRKQNGILRGTLQVKTKGHIIVVGWNERSKEIIETLISLQPNTTIVLVDSTLKKNPFPEDDQLYFLRGKPFSDEVFMKANLKDAKMIMITADASKNEMDADMQTILNIVAVKGFAPKAYCVAEILTGEQVVNAKRAGADEIIPSNKISGTLMLQTIVSRGISSAFLDFINTKKGVKMELLKNHPFSGYTIESASVILLKERKTLIGVYRKGNAYIPPSPDVLIDSKDHLLVIGHG